MCNAYELGKRGGSFPSRVKAKAAKELLGKADVQLIRRTDPAPVFTSDDDFVTMRWGFDRPGLGSINNSRADKLSSPMWKVAFEERRCVIPVAAYYEWSGPKGNKRTHRFTRPDGNWLWMAGIWEDSKDFGPCFSMITTTPNSLVAPIHTRMPVALTDAEVSPFLNGGIDRFNPPTELLEVSDAPNPLKKPKPPSAQGELF